MKDFNTLYFEILIWAYEKLHNGFTLRDIKSNFQLTDTQLQWVMKVFRSNYPQTDNLFNLLIYNEKEHEEYLILTSKGISTAVSAMQYLHLKEVEKNSQRAEKIAKIAILVGIIVGIVQIVIGLLQLTNQDAFFV